MEEHEDVALDIKNKILEKFYHKDND